MRAILVFVVLGLLYLLVKNSGDLEAGEKGINPVLLGYGALFAAGIVTSELLRPVLSLMGATSRFVVVAIIAGLVWFGFQQARNSGILPLALTDPGRVATTNEPVRQTWLPLAWDGVYRAVAQVNNMSLGVLIDTGAALVILQYEEAERLGLHPERFKFDQRITVADRKIIGAKFVLGSVRIDDVEMFNVVAAVAEPGALETSVIGLSFLTRLSTAAIIDDQFYMRQ
ncbi:MAG: clan AA aspartic protease (TIGR02281 family) [Paracoccaceae bacterium]|jgi:clan AA aspartic protease (TIGR02281 family)